jgi:hypothetical protein
MQGSLLAVALSGRFAFRLAEKEGEGVGGFVGGSAMVEFEGDTVGALIEEGD